mgnify:FL=1|jgi:nuclear-control-of-ATPase protein 2|tara:strand:- start:10555 stop:12789 length:2235 start_codon:yes stop_codon:yes gene_type:complete
MASDGPPVRRLFRDVARDVLDAAEEKRRARGEHGSFWDVAKELRKRATHARARARERGARSARAVKSLPVFFDKDGRTGASAVWWRDAFAVSAALDGDESRAEEASEASDLGHAARATLFFAQDMSRELLLDLHVATSSLSFWEVLRDRPSGQARFLLFNTGPSNFVALAREGTYRLWCHARAALNGTDAKFALPSASARVIIDGRVNALNELQVSLASVVGRVHHHADTVANASGESSLSASMGGESREMTRQAIIEATDGLLECLEQVKEYATKSRETVGDLAKVSNSSRLAARDSPKLLKSLHRLSHGKRLRDMMPDLPEPTPRSSTRSSGDFDRDLSPGPTRPLSRLQRLASMDLSKQPEDAAVAHRFRQPLVVNGRPLSLPKVNDTIWQALNRVEQEWSEVRDSSHDALEVHAKPSKHVRRWLLYTIGSATFVISTTVMIRHSRLCGSDDLDNTLHAAKAAFITFLKMRILDPVKELRDELKAAFVSDRPDDAIERLEESKASLDRMLGEYTKQASRPGYSESLYRAYKSVGGGSKGEGEEKVLVTPDPTRLVTARVEEELKSPLTNMLAGDLMQLLLLQTQVMKVEMEGALMQMDQLMRANRLNFSLMACFPAALGMYTTVLAMKASLSLSVYRRRSKHREEMRMLLHEAERALTSLKIAERRSVQQGMLIYALNSLYQAIQRHQHLFSRDEWRSVRIDVLELADPSIPIDNKLVTVARLSRTKALIPEPHRVAGRHL